MNTNQNPVLELLNYYKSIYRAENPSEEMLKSEGEIPKSIKEKIQTQFGPEPFYGYFDDDMSKDALLLLLNPGEVNNIKNVCSDDEFNQFHKKRYLEWTKKEHLEEGERLKEIHTDGNKWREDRRKEINNIICVSEASEEVPFMHTMEFFPYHSKEFKFSSEKEINWICKSKTSELLMNSIKYLAEQRKVKYIFGIGISWVKIFKYYGYVPEKKDIYEVKNDSTGKFRFRVYKYKFTKDSVPVIISILGGGKISLPKNEETVKTIRKMLELNS